MPRTGAPDGNAEPGYHGYRYETLRAMGTGTQDLDIRPGESPWAMPPRD